MRRSATAHRENRYAHPTWRHGEHRIGELRTAAARGGALASPPHRHLFPSISLVPELARKINKACGGYACVPMCALDGQKFFCRRKA